MDWNKLLCSERERGSIAKNPRDIRSSFRKDYHRIIGSPAFRRLQDKAQVYPLLRGDFVRTRLTHSLEVSSFCGSLGESVFRRLIDEGKPGVTEKIREDCCDILECAGLVHDIGNPPFGHFGEFSIRRWFEENFPKLSFNGRPVTELLSEQMKNDFLHFEGNAQAFRVLTRLHCLVDMETGMNLTYALLNTIVKYPVSSLQIDPECGDISAKKMGFYTSEQALFEDISKKTGAVGCRFPLTFILEAADDIAYKTADIEDAAVKGFVTPQLLLSELSEKFYVKKYHSDECNAEILRACEELKQSLADAERLGMSKPDIAAVSRWIIKIQTMMIYAAADAFCENYDEIMAGRFKTELLAASRAEGVADALGKTAYKYAFRSESIVRSELSESAAMDFLMGKIVRAALNFGTPHAAIYDKDLIEVLPADYLKICTNACEGADEAQQCYRRLLFATDCVCSMTDGFAREFFLELSGITPVK